MENGIYSYTHRPLARPASGNDVSHRRDFHKDCIPVPARKKETRIPAPSYQGQGSLSICLVSFGTVARR